MFRSLRLRRPHLRPSSLHRSALHPPPSSPPTLHPPALRPWLRFSSNGNHLKAAEGGSKPYFDRTEALYSLLTVGAITFAAASFYNGLQAEKKRLEVFKEILQTLKTMAGSDPTTQPTPAATSTSATTSTVQ